MFLHRIHLDPRCREARRDLADSYQLHSCRAFCEPDRKCPEGEFLWRLEPETDNSLASLLKVSAVTCKVLTLTTRPKEAVMTLYCLANG